MRFLSAVAALLAKTLGMAGLLGVLLVSQAVADSISDPKVLLDAAKAEMLNLPKQQRTWPKDQALAFSIALEAAANPQEAAASAASLDNPFYSSLALGSVAAAVLKRDPEAAEEYYRKAVDRAFSIKTWTAQHATSLTFVYALIEKFPDDQARELLDDSLQELLTRERRDESIRSHPLLTLAKVTVRSAPASASDLLFGTAVKSHHYWETSEYLATHLAENDLPGTLKKAEESYGKSVGSSSNAMRAVLFVMARTDLDKALDAIWQMRFPDNEVAAVTLAERLFKAGKLEEAKKVAKDLETDRPPTIEWSTSTLKRLRAQLDSGKSPDSADTTVTASAIDEFIKNPNADTLESFSSKARLVFRDKNQAAKFVTAALPLVPNMRRIFSDPWPNWNRQSAYGLLVTCAAVSGDITQAMEISKQIETPVLRISYLMEAYATLKPLPNPVNEWPFHYVAVPVVSVGK